jgi:ribosomal protein S18 acetylase RimI-like enzyme
MEDTHQGTTAATSDAAITFEMEPDLPAHEFIDLLRRSTLGERRPIHDLKTMQGMIQNASSLVTARHNSLLVGVARSISDFSFCTYLSDLAVDSTYQRQGIGKRLLQSCHEHAGLHTNLILNAAPAAAEYYPKIGLEKHNSCWMIHGVRKQEEDKKP